MRYNDQLLHSRPIGEAHIFQTKRSYWVVVVSVLSFNCDDPSSDTAEVHKFFCRNFFETSLINKKSSERICTFFRKFPKLHVPRHLGNSNTSIGRNQTKYKLGAVVVAQTVEQLLPTPVGNLLAIYARNLRVQSRNMGIFLVSMTLES